MSKAAASRPKFSWPAYPANAQEFEALMIAMDGHLHASGVRPDDRWAHVGFLLRDAFGWAGLLLPARELANEPGFTGNVLMAKVHSWYDEVYGVKLNTDLGPGHVPVPLANAIWRARMPFTAGRCIFFADRDLQNRGANAIEGGQPATLNVLCMIDELSPGLTSRLTNIELSELQAFYQWAFENLRWREKLTGHVLFDRARHDYDASVDNLMNARYAQSWEASSLAIEKTIKGFLSIAGLQYDPIHDLKRLATQLSSECGISLHEKVLGIAQFWPGARYGGPPPEQAALLANHAVLGTLEMLSKSRKAAELLAEMKCSSSK